MYIKQLAHNRLCFSFQIKSLKDHTKNCSVSGSLIHHEIKITQQKFKTDMNIVSLIFIYLMIQLFYIQHFHLRCLIRHLKVS